MKTRRGGPDFPFVTAVRSLVMAMLIRLPAFAGPDPGDPASWVVEQMPGGRVEITKDAMIIEDAAGCTVWWREKLTAPMEISYEAAVVSAGGPLDRVSDLNCFWMAREADSDEAPFLAKPSRGGRFSDYNSLLAYYVGHGGNGNTTTRFRRYDGTSGRPLLPEHDRGEPRYLLEPNRTYRLRLVAADGVAEYWCDGEKIFSHPDPEPLLSGWFALRTVHSHLIIRKLSVGRPARATDEVAGGAK